MTRFDTRTAPCDPCNGTGEDWSRPYRSGGIRHGLCEACEGHGEIDAGCTDCRVVAPLNSDGFCRSCEESGLVEVEHIAPGRIAA